MEANNVISDFSSMRESFQNGIKEYFCSSNSSLIVKTQKELHSSEGDKRMALEQSIRDKFLQVWTEDPSNVEEFKRIISLGIELVQKEVLTPVMPVTLLSDMFDTVTLSVAEKLFQYVQESLSIWKSELFFAPCKNVILRMCNDLLKRLPKAENTSFCGQILLFLALFFPFSERSGLNIISEFNVDNVTKYNDKPDINFEGDIVTSIIPEQLTSKVDNNFYLKFWSIQEIFRNPTLCYTDAKWKEFVENSDFILKLFTNCKVEKVTSSKSPDSKLHDNNFCYSMKYLTSEKLLVLQLNDTNFRRVLFLQYMILFQYLRSFVKSRPESYDLNSEQVEWIKKSVSTIQKMCKESSPDGNKFFKSIQKILERDSFWNKWKNESCPAIKRKKSPASKEPPKIAKFSFDYTLANVYEQSKISNKMTTTVGEPKEWTIKGNYLERCKNFVNYPNLKTRIEDILLEADPAAMIEPEYKKVNSMKFVWQTLKLYHQKGPPRCFNSPAQTVPNKIPEYVEYMSKQISRDITYKSIQAKLKKQVGELKVRHGENKEDDDKNEETKSEDATSMAEKSEASKEEDEDDEKMQVEEDVELDEEASEEEEANSDDEQHSDDEKMETGGDEENQTNGDVEGKSDNSKEKVSRENLEKIAKEMSRKWKQVADKLGYKSDEIEFFSKQEQEDYERGLNMLDVWFSNEPDSNLDALHTALDSLDLTQACQIVQDIIKK